MDPALPWLWRGPAAVVPIGPLAWEPLCTSGAAIKDKKDKQKKSENEIKTILDYLSKSSGVTRALNGETEDRRVSVSDMIEEKLISLNFKMEGDNKTRNVGTSEH